MQLDPTTFSSLGITLPSEQALTFETYFTETLEERIGLAIAELLNDEQLNQLLDVQESGDSKAITQWLKTNVPDYTAVAQDEFDILMGEVAQHADTISA